MTNTPLHAVKDAWRVCALVGHKGQQDSRDAQDRLCAVLDSWLKLGSSFAQRRKQHCPTTLLSATNETLFLFVCFLSFYCGFRGNTDL